MKSINLLLTGYNHNTGSISRIKYIVIHYVGAQGGARANCQYYAGSNRNASAHYFIGFDGEIWQSVEDANIAWHCGAITALKGAGTVQAASDAVLTGY
ncbi:N-acetylmuramoyl-L-alanine amidase, partial [Lacrimispora sp. AGF001]